jgi:hypothetical protein
MNVLFDIIRPFSPLSRILGPVCMLARWMAINVALPAKFIKTLMEHISN